jgi:hypothetical protein
VRLYVGAWIGTHGKHEANPCINLVESRAEVVIGLNALQSFQNETKK